MELFKKINKWKIFFVILIILSILRVYIQYNTPLFYIGTSPHDDDLLISYAENIATGNWLGTYNYLTLVKGITYSLFLVFVIFSRIPYAIALATLNILSAVLFVNSIKLLVKNRFFLGILYLFLIFSPVTMEFQIGQRIYRNSLTFSMILLVLAGFIGTYLNLEKGKKTIKWSILAGISLFLFWNLREDTIWIMPFCVVSSIVSVIAIIIKYVKSKNKKIFLNLIIVIIPYIIFIIGNGIICMINYHYYGLFTTNDRTNSEFTDLVSLMIKIDYEDDENVNTDKCLVSKNKMEYIVDHSETLSSIKDNIMDSYSAWATMVGMVDNVYGDLFVWALRDALNVSGYYETAKKVDDFCKQARLELEEQIDNGELSIADGIFLSSSTRMLRFEDIPNLLQTTVDAIDELMSYRTIETTYTVSGGTDEQIRDIEGLTNSLLLKNNDSKYTIIYEMFVKVDNMIIKIYQKIAVPLFIISMISYIIITVLQIRNIFEKDIEFFNRWLILTGILASFIILAMAVSWFIQFLSKSWRVFYMSGVIPLVQIFELVVLYTLVCYIIKIIKNKKIKEKNDENSSIDTML